ncbi:hypothetical protein C6P40_003145 [Pichia californica]|uniref:Protein SOK1 n=1 Tax=Pichia californica TaxID=460514 RepID=A0A9P6WGW9_9ASCO|nr:hypothetical protein C6P40_003145 [[Candida] californica]
MNHVNNSNEDQDIERPPHFKNVFDKNNSVSAAVAGVTEINTNNIIASESRRPSLVVVPSVVGTGNHDIRHLTMSSKNSSNDNSNNLIDNNISSPSNSSINDDVEMKDIDSIHSNLNIINNNIDNSLHDSKSLIDNSNTSNLNATSSSSSSSSSSSTTATTTNSTSPTKSSLTTATNDTIQFLNLPSNKKLINKKFISSSSSSSSSKKNSKNLKPIKKFRSKSLPNIHIPSKRSHNNNAFTKHLNLNHNQNHNIINNSNIPNNYHNLHHNHHHLHNLHHLHQQQQQQQQMLLLPPVNPHSMHEIDLQEVLKNPQLRHDILFDPQLQFRPNLDGDRGRRKKIQSENYWNMIKFEIEKLFNENSLKQIDNNSPIIIMFQCLKSILVSLIPSKDINSIDEILDISLLIQQLNSKCFNFINFFDWICSIFKLHCAPMRDSWVDDLDFLFQKACNNNNNQINIDYLVEGLKTLFLILEAMKLDVANHQIRILRPLLCSSAVSFEKEYFKSAIKKNKINFTPSMLWFKKNSLNLKSKNSRQILNYSVLNLLSCSSMCHQFPNTLNFDHSRLLLLRADIRHIICTKLCSILYKNLIYQNNLDKSLLNDSNILNFKKQIVNIIVDENGNSKWTKNLKNLSIQMVNNLFGNLDSSKIDFAYNWLLKQTQPNSKVYSLLEAKLFEKILPYLTSSSTSSLDNTDNSKINDDLIVNDELRNVVDRLNQLIEFNYNVFNSMYSDYLN